MQKILFYNKFTIRLYMFRTLCAHEEVILYYTASDIITLVGGRPVHRLRANLCTGRPRTGVTIPDAV